MGHLGEERFEALPVRDRLIALVIAMTDRDVHNQEHIHVAGTFVDLMARHVKEKYVDSHHHTPFLAVDYREQA